MSALDTLTESFAPSASGSSWGWWPGW